jgi:hypothetical protein
VDSNALDAMESGQLPVRNQRVTRPYFIETLFQMIIHCAEDGNSAKISKIIDNLYTLGLMPVTQADLDAFVEEFTRPTDRDSYYVVNDKRLRWIEENGVAHHILRADQFGMTELVFNEEEGEARFRARWC